MVADGQLLLRSIGRCKLLVAPEFAMEVWRAFHAGALAGGRGLAEILIQLRAVLHAAPLHAWVLKA